MGRRRLLTAGLVIALLPIIAPASTAEPGQRSITLISGDRIALHGKDVSPLPTEGRAGMTYHSYVIAGHTYVVPLDAAALVASGRLDRRLFDVTALQEFGYAETSDIPLIVAGRLPGVQPDRTLSATQAVRAPKGRLWQAIRTSGAKVWLDGKRKIDLAQSVPQIGAPAAWEAGYTGKGVTVAVLDTGVDATHPDFKGRIADTRNFTSDKDIDDTIGHGTHVASTIAGSGAKYRGVAPDATLVIGKVCQSDGCAESAILAGMEWAAREKKAQVVNLSLGGPNTEDVDPLEAAIDKLTAETGTLFVVAAGNQAYAPESVSSPSTADAALSVGAVDKKDVEEAYSNRGPRFSDGAIKPEIAGPGTGIVAARATNSGLPKVDGVYTTMSGTSMATPHVTGAAALLAQHRPGWHAQELKSVLVSAAQPTAQGDVFAEGAGRVDVARAVRQDVYATTTVNLGLQRWPHDDDQPVSGAVTYRNAGSVPVTLVLSVNGTFTLNQKEITVPAGGEAAATVTADTRTGPDGRLTGRVTAVAGDARIVTPVTVNKEVESYDLKLSQLGRDGKPAPIDTAMLIGMDSPGVSFPYDPDGTTTLRRPKGKYILDSLILAKNELSHVTQPLLVLDHDTVLTLDARDTKLVRPAVQGVGGDVALQDVGLLRTWDSPAGRAGFESGILQFGFGAPVLAYYTAQYGPSLPKDDLLAWVNFKIAEPGANRDYLNSPYVYHLFWGLTGRYPDGFAPQVGQGEFAAIRQHYDAMNTGKYGYTWSFGSTEDVHRRAGVPLTLTLPFERTEYYQAEGRTWLQSFGQGSKPTGFPDLSNEEEANPQTLVAGRSSVRHWNRGVFGPAFTPAGSPLQYSSVRGEDTIVIHAPGYSDGTADRYGYPLATKASRIALYRDGRLVADRDNLFSNTFTGQPAQEATYRAEVDLRLDDSVLPLSSRTSTAWTFKSAHVTDTQPLPLMLAGISPNVDGQNTAKAGNLIVLPVRIQRNPGSAAAKVTEVTVESSFDDGVTWRDVPVFPGDEIWYGLETNSAAPGFASLRVTATDDAGNKVEQTIVHAYRIGY